MVKITGVQSGTLAHAAGILPGDELISANGHEIGDVLDYRFYLTDRTVRLTLQREGKSYSVSLNKGEYDDIGLEFSTPLMDKKHSCANRCVFCFIDQLPKGMRESLYFKDDDDRLSFLHGNYVTLTNLHEKDIQRILEMHISPVNVSVHTTNPELRVKMMKNKRAGEVLSYLRTMADAGIALCAQIVLCKGWNDGKELQRTMEDLVSYYPALRSCSVVPLGLTKHREGLCHLELFSPAEARQVIEQVTEFGNRCLEKYGTRLFYCSDEFYIRAKIPLPGEEFYEDYSQIENGVGMLTSLESEFRYELDFLDDILPDVKEKRDVSLITGEAAYDHIRKLATLLEEKVPDLQIRVYKIVNHFFGETVTVSGLLTATDVIEQLHGKELGEELLFPSVMLRADGDLFLDNLSPKDLSEALHVPVRAVKNDGADLVAAMLGIAKC